MINHYLILLLLNMNNMANYIRKPFINWSNLPILVNKLYSYKPNTNENCILELDIDTNDYNILATGKISNYHIGKLDKSNIIINSNIEIKYLDHKYNHVYRIDEKCEYNYEYKIDEKCEYNSNIDQLKFKYSLEFIKCIKGSYNDYQDKINFSSILNKDEKLFNNFWLILPYKTHSKIDSIKDLIDENKNLIKIIQIK